VDDAGVTDIIGAASLLVSEDALATLTERATKPSRTTLQPSDPASPDGERTAMQRGES
jgi:hypothetical protein